MNLVTAAQYTGTLNPYQRVQDAEKERERILEKLERERKVVRAVSETELHDYQGYFINTKA